MYEWYTGGSREFDNSTKNIQKKKYLKIYCFILKHIDGKKQ